MSTPHTPTPREFRRLVDATAVLSALIIGALLLGSGLPAHDVYTVAVVYLATVTLTLIAVHRHTSPPQTF